MGQCRASESMDIRSYLQPSACSNLMHKERAFVNFPQNWYNVYFNPALDFSIVVPTHEYEICTDRCDVSRSLDEERLAMSEYSLSAPCFLRKLGTVAADLSADFEYLWEIHFELRTGNYDYQRGLRELVSLA